jgi:8-oxo-dGTP diphosphatase
VEASKQSVCVSGLIRNASGEVLLVKSPRRGWECPGGKVEAGESLIVALVREVQEESTCEAEVGRLVGVYSRLTPPEMLVFMFLAQHRSGKPRGSSETVDAGWFSPAEAQAMVTLPPQAVRLRDALMDPDRPVYRVYRINPYREEAGSGL